MTLALLTQPASLPFPRSSDLAEMVSAPLGRAEREQHSRRGESCYGKQEAAT